MKGRRTVLRSAIAALLLVGLVACNDGVTPRDRTAPTSPSPDPVPAAVASTPSPRVADRLPPGVREKPGWVGTRVLKRGPSGFGIATSTPSILRDRRFATEDVLPPPSSDRFASRITRVPRRVLRRSSWGPGCPVRAGELAYVNVSFWGFDERAHTGELIVHRSVARDVVSVFKELHRTHWPIEEMRITTAPELDAPPTGDGNNTGAFACRPSRTTSEWSEHAYGSAVDINPFHNPYVRDELVLPELAIAYRDRDRQRPGMIRPGDVVTRAFAAIGWRWGGDWASAKDWMHFSASGR